MGCDWWCRVSGECNCRWLDALYNGGLKDWIVKAIRRDVFYRTDDVVGSKMAPEMLCFTMETACGGMRR